MKTYFLNFIGMNVFRKRFHNSSGFLTFQRQRDVFCEQNSYVTKSKTYFNYNKIYVRMLSSELAQKYFQDNVKSTAAIF